VILGKSARSNVEPTVVPHPRHGEPFDEWRVVPHAHSPGHAVEARDRPVGENLVPAGTRAFRGVQPPEEGTYVARSLRSLSAIARMNFQTFGYLPWAHRSSSSSESSSGSVEPSQRRFDKR